MFGAPCRGMRAAIVHGSAVVEERWSLGTCAHGDDAQTRNAENTLPSVLFSTLFIDFLSTLFSTLLSILFSTLHTGVRNIKADTFSFWSPTIFTTVCHASCGCEDFLFAAFFTQAEMTPYHQEDKVPVAGSMPPH